MCFYSHKAVFHIDRNLRKMLIIFIECADGHCIQWQHRTEQAILGREISPYLVERQTVWALTARPTNAVWWQSHEITSGFWSISQPLRGKRDWNFHQLFTSHKWTHAGTDKVNVVFLHICSIWMFLGRHADICSQNALITHSGIDFWCFPRVNVWPRKIKVRCVFFVSLLCSDAICQSEPNVHTETERARRCVSFCLVSVSPLASWQPED